MGTTYNLAYLEELAAGDNSFLQSMIDDFVTQTPTTLMHIHEAIDNVNYEEIYRLVHRFIPTIEYMGANAIQSQFREIEQLSKTKNNIEEIKNIFLHAKENTFALIELLKNDFVNKKI